jgi:hypothetical protein
LAVILLPPIVINALDTSHFVNYYSFYRRTLGVAESLCTSTHDDFNANPSPDTCKSHVTCLIDNIDEVNKVDMASASVLLCLAPTMLAMVGPSIAEISLLSSRRPILSFLVTMSAPALNIGPLFEFQSPVQALKGRSKDIHSITDPKPGSRIYGLIVGLQYVFLLGSIVNVVTNSVQLGAWTVVSWKCQATYMPALSMCIAIFTWLLVFRSFKFYKWKTATVSGDRKDSGKICAPTGQHNTFDQTRSWWRDEFSTWKLRPYRFELESDKDRILATALNAVAWISVNVSL